MTLASPSPQATAAATLVDEWIRAGLTDAVICPGSRSTPLARAVYNDNRLRVHVRLDERSAGFFAVGLGAVSGRPAVVVTTSGTAAVELHPAMVEAHLACVPLIACTADRPPSLHHVGAPQTVQQDALFAGSVRWAFSPGLAGGTEASWWRSVGARSVAEACAGPNGPGPVHLNLAYEDPLVGEPAPLPPGRPGGRPWHQVAGRADGPPPGVERLLDPGLRGLVVAGARCGDPDTVLGLGAALGWPVLADPRSGARRPHGGMVAAADALLRIPDVAAALRPEVVIRLGEAWASKVLNGWLAESGARQILVDPYGRWLDPDRSATDVVRCSVAALLPASARSGLSEGAWLARWQGLEAAAAGAIATVLDGRETLVEPGVARAVYRATPARGALVVSSSMPVRDVEWYGAPRPDPPMVLANRGANGIDGVVSTTLGVTQGHAGPTVGLLGDLAFLHDVGALLGAGAGRVPGGRPAAAGEPLVGGPLAGGGGGPGCTLVVVDNNGGGIFSFLPQATGLSSAEFEALFGTPHNLDLAAVGRAFGLQVAVPTTSPELRDALDVALASTDEGARLVLVHTDRAANVAVHDEIHAAVAAAVSGLL